MVQRVLSYGMAVLLLAAGARVFSQGHLFAPSAQAAGSQCPAHGVSAEACPPDAAMGQGGCTYGSSSAGAMGCPYSHDGKTSGKAAPAKATHTRV